MKKLSIILLNAIPDKKTKSLGNKCLIKIKNKYVIDHYLKAIKQIFKNPEIIIVGGHESKRLSKYLYDNKTHKIHIKHIEHDMDRFTNIGTSIATGIKEMSGGSCLFVNTSLLFDSKLLDLISGIKSSHTIISKNNNSNTGCIIDENNKIINCHYGLPYGIFDFLYINNKDMNIFKNLIRTKNFDKLYMFEIINLCIANDIIINGINSTLLKTIYNSKDKVSDV